MDGNAKRKLVAAGVAALAVAGGGAAIAATQFGSPKQESQAVVNDAAKQLGVQPSALGSALKKALENRVDAAVSAGRLTKAQGDALKSRIESGELPFFFGGEHHGGPGHFGHLDAAAKYLGLTEAQLDAKVEAGQTLAQVAKSQKKDVDGLIQALVNSEKSELKAAVTAGRLTNAQEQSLESGLKQRITNLVNNGGPPHPDFDHGRRFGGAPGYAPGPPAFDGPTA